MDKPAIANLATLAELDDEALAKVSGASGATHYELNPPSALDVTRVQNHINTAGVFYGIGPDLLRLT